MGITEILAILSTFAAASFGLGKFCYHRPVGYDKLLSSLLRLAPGLVLLPVGVPIGTALSDYLSIRTRLSEGEEAVPNRLLESFLGNLRFIFLFLLFAVFVYLYMFSIKWVVNGLFREPDSTPD